MKRNRDLGSALSILGAQLQGDPCLAASYAAEKRRTEARRKRAETWLLVLLVGVIGLGLWLLAGMEERSFAPVGSGQ